MAKVKEITVLSGDVVEVRMPNDCCYEVNRTTTGLVVKIKTIDPGLLFENKKGSYNYALGMVEEGARASKGGIPVHHVNEVAKK